MGEWIGGSLDGWMDEFQYYRYFTLFQGMQASGTYVRGYCTSEPSEEIGLIDLIVDGGN